MKRIISAILTLGLLFIFCCGSVAAVDVPDTRASYTLMGYSAELYTGDHKGEVYIGYDVQASKLADSVGIKSIVFYKANGDYVTTIYGSVSNGLIETDTVLAFDDYYYTLTSGVSYYAKVTVFATVGNLTDSRTITTSTVKAP